MSKLHNSLVLFSLPGYPLEPGESAWDFEAATRDTMTRLLRAHMNRPGQAKTPFLVVMSDMDEIPSHHTLKLLKACDFGSKIHLQLRNFLYRFVKKLYQRACFDALNSFEWYFGPSSWRASVHLWSAMSYYRHSKSTETILADSGWHCSYCFRTIPEYVIKMKGFSHADRIGGRIDLLDPKRIQDTICHGKDIFGMLPEAYSVKDFLLALFARTDDLFLVP